MTVAELNSVAAAAVASVNGVTEIAEFNGEPWPDGSSVGPFRYFRIYISDNNGSAYVSIEELDVYEGVTDVADGITEGNTAASSTDSGSSRSNAFDGNYTNGTAVWANNGDGVPAWLSFDTGASRSPTSYAITCQNHGVGPDRAPQDFTFQGSNDGLTGPWTDIDTRTGETAWSPGETRTFGL